MIPAQTGYADATRREISMSWAGWKARELNRLFDQQGIKGPDRNAANIKPETIKHGLEQPEGKR